MFNMVELEILENATLTKFGSCKIVNLQELNLPYDKLIFRFNLNGILQNDYFDTRYNNVDELPSDCSLYVEVQSALKNLLDR